MHLKIPLHQAEAIAQLQTNRVVPNVRHTQTTESKSAEDNHDQGETLKDANKETPWHIRNFNRSDKLLNFIEEQN